MGIVRRPVDGGCWGFPPAPHGTPAEGEVIRSDGWPAAGVRVSAPCDADDPGFGCTAVTNLLAATTSPACTAPSSG